MTTEQELEELDKQIDRLQAKKYKIEKNHKLKCFHCKEQTKVKKLTYIQPYWWIEEGHNSYTSDSEDMYWQCPHCEKKNREYLGKSDTENDYELIKSLRFCFDGSKDIDRDEIQYNGWLLESRGI